MALDIKNKVLVVEDNKLERYAIVQMLEKKFLSANIYAADNGMQGLELFKKKLPDIILTDIKMPVMDGIQMISEIRKYNQDIPIIVISAFETNLFQLKLHEKLNITRWILKPITMMTIFEVLDNVL